MNRILVPTDFSEIASNALNAALQLARKCSSQLHLFTNLNLPKNWAKSLEKPQSGDPEVVKVVSRTVKKLEAIVDAHPDVKITYSYDRGKLEKSIDHCIKQQQIDLVVMGSHGQGGLSEVFIGSNTQKVVRSIHSPVLVVKQPLEDIEFKKIVFASSFNLSEKGPFLKLKEIVAPFSPEFIFLGIKSSYLFSVPTEITLASMGDFEALADPFPTSSYVFKSDNIESSIREFANEIGADLIAISNHNQRPLKRMLVGSNVEALINHSQLPVLSIDYR